MKKALLIGLKDLQIAARDRTALLLMLAAPFVLTLGLGLVTGSLFGSSQSGLQDIPVILVDHDGQQLGQALVETFTSPELEGLLQPTVHEGAAAADAAAPARAAVEEDTVAAAVIIPAGFTAGIIPGDDGVLGEPRAIEIVANPARPISSDVVEAIVQQFLGNVESASVAGQVAVTQLVQQGLITPQEAPAAAAEVGQQVGGAGGALVNIQSESLAGDPEAQEFNVLSILAPGMAIFFLMYTVTYGGTSLLVERSEWTLQRLMTTPTAAASILGGKVFGIFLTGFAQTLILIFGSTLLFGLDWGQPLLVVLVVAATVLGATGWGLLLASLARTPAQVANAGTAMMLLFGIVSGTLTPTSVLPQAFSVLRLITPNAWGLDAIAELALGAGLAEIGEAIIALLLMALLLGGVAVFIFRRRQVFA